YFENTYTFSFTTVKLGDLNGDDQVDILDLLWISSRLGPVVDPASRKADVNGDNVVNILDLLEVAQYLNLSTGS
ncbi:MAG: dockerin type I domain-containing protein, partial [Desulfotomaculaceae bacterium]|nr:dockerin type I domain-containing protein [Desulfotomaculaceae bacterium]